MIKHQHMTKKWKYIAILLFLCSPAAVFATTGHAYLGVSAGATWGYLGNNNSKVVYEGNQVTDTYSLTNRSSTTAVVGANGGYEFTVNDDKMAIALGIGAYTTPGHYTYRGNVSEAVTGFQTTTLYSNKFTVTSTRVMAEAQFTWLFEQLSPFLNLGLGSAWNYFNHYTETPSTNNGFVALPPFKSNMSKTFAYQVGLGVGYLFNFVEQQSIVKHERLSVGYRLVGLGDVSSGTRGTAYLHTVSFGTLTSNEVYVTYTHLF